MKLGWEWRDYELRGPPSIALNDYTMTCFGCEDILDKYLFAIKKIRDKNESIRWMIGDFWGTGKSTLMYNLCNRINERLFFFPELYPPTLAFFAERPQKPVDLLEYTFQNGLPMPWLPLQSKEKCVAKRRQLLAKALRKIVFAWLSKAVRAPKKTRKLAKSIAILNLDTFPQRPTETTKSVDESKDKYKYEKLVNYLAEYFENAILSKKEDFLELNQDNTLEYLPDLIYPENSVNFLESYSKLCGQPRKRLRDFNLFNSLCQLVHIHLLLIIDEVAEWDQVTKAGLDDFLLEMLPKNKLSAILISRADIERGIRGQKRFRYFHLRSYLKQIKLQDPTIQEILEIAKGIMATSRTTYCLKLFPFNYDFILHLSNLSIRCDHFNTRMFIRGIIAALRFSLNWERENPDITADYINKSELIEKLAEDLKLEDMKGLQPLNLLERKQEIRRKVKAARCISDFLLSSFFKPPTRYMLEIAKEVTSEHFQIPILSDIEILAYTKKGNRKSVNKIMRALKGTSISARGHEHLRELVQEIMESRIDNFSKSI